MSEWVTKERELSVEAVMASVIPFDLEIPQSDSFEHACILDQN